MTKKSNIQEIANRAGVSKAAVSYVINNVNKVSAETKEKILKIMEELDYTPNLSARSLINGQSKLIGVTLPITMTGDIAGKLLETNPFFSEYLGGIHKIISSHDYDILLSGIQAKGKYKNWIKGRGLDGIIFLGTYPQDIFEEVMELGIPAVLTDIYEPYTKNFHCVNTNDLEGSYIATKHLIELGHQRIGFVSGSIKKSPINHLRFLGYSKAMKEANLPLDHGRIYECPMTFEGGVKLAQKLLLNPLKFSALTIASDIAALGIMKTFQSQGVKIPDQVSIVGFDDISVASFTSPGLTTIRQHIVKKGEIAAKLIMKDILAGTKTNESKTVKCSLVVRESTTYYKR